MWKISARLKVLTGSNRRGHAPWMPKGLQVHLLITHGACHLPAGKSSMTLLALTTHSEFL